MVLSNIEKMLIGGALLGATGTAAGIGGSIHFEHKAGLSNTPQQRETYNGYARKLDYLPVPSFAFMFLMLTPFVNEYLRKQDQR